MQYEQTNVEYQASVTRVLRHIDSNLDSDLSVECLADLSYFSKYHFHRLFKAAVGENLNAYVTKRRLQRAAKLLRSTPGLSVTQVALQVGFQSAEHFSRSFKRKFGITANDYRRHDGPSAPKNSKIYQDDAPESFYRVYEQARRSPPREFDVIIREQPEFNVASVTEVFGKDGTNLVNAYLELVAWSQNEGLFEEYKQRFAISYDDIEVTPPEQYRMEFCIEVPKCALGHGRIGTRRIVGGTYALIHVEGAIQDVAQAWDHLYKYWLPTSRYRPRDEPAVEIFLQGPETIGWEHFDLEVGIPIEPSR